VVSKEDFKNQRVSKEYLDEEKDANCMGSSILTKAHISIRGVRVKTQSKELRVLR
jgi:hypothetical protein